MTTTSQTDWLTKTPIGSISYFWNFFDAILNFFGTNFDIFDSKLNFSGTQFKFF